MLSKSSAFPWSEYFNRSCCYGLAFSLWLDPPEKLCSNFQRRAPYLFSRFHWVWNCSLEYFQLYWSVCTSIFTLLFVSGMHRIVIWPDIGQNRICQDRRISDIRPFLLSYRICWTRFRTSGTKLPDMLHKFCYSYLLYKYSWLLGWKPKISFILDVSQENLIIVNIYHKTKYIYCATNLQTS